ncbi:MAG: cytochrome c-type biogenesis protein CcmH [Methylococcaceae bacterium]|nr:cytochrome c-type biogenesis protein CcmH [Methylococcaceae bacterium]
MKQGLLVLGLALALNAQAVEIRQFEDPAKQQIYENLVKELRCLVCQNQSLADSDADLAKDLRTEVYNIIQSGKSEQEAIQFLVDRYGDFVLYNPPLKTTTSLLWLGPFALLLGGGAFLWRHAKRRSAARETEPSLTDDERHRLQELKKKIEG